MLPTSYSSIPAGVAHSPVLSHTLNFSCRSASRYVPETQMDHGNGRFDVRLRAAVGRLACCELTTAKCHHDALHALEGEQGSATPANMDAAPRHISAAGGGRGQALAATGKGRPSAAART